MQARPRLSTVAPLTYAICWGFAVVNILLGLGMFFLYQTPIPLTVANILSYQQWGILFLGVGVLSIYTLLRNYWWATKNLMFAGLTLKAVWAVALIIRCIDAPPTILITAVWLFLAYVQAVTYIYFLPKNGAGKKEPTQ